MSEAEIMVNDQPVSLNFHLPGTWFVLDLLTDERAKQSIEAMVRDVCGSADENAKVRALMRKRMQEMCDKAKGADARMMYFGRELAPDSPFPVVISLYQPRDLRVSPALGVRYDAVFDVFRQGFEDQDVELVEVMGMNYRALRTVEIEHDPTFDALVPEDDSPEAMKRYEEAKTLDFSQMRVSYWCYVPGTKNIVLVTMHTQLTMLKNMMLELFDLLLMASSFVDAQGALIESDCFDDDPEADDI